MTGETVGSQGTSRATIRWALGSGIVRSVVSLPVSLFVLPFVLHRLSPQQYGVWAVVSSLVMLAALGDLGVRTEITRRVAEASGRGDAEDVRLAVRRGMTVLMPVAGLILVVGSALAGPVVHFALPHGTADGQAVLLLRLVFLLLTLSLVTGGYFAVLGGLQRYDRQNYAEIAALLAGATASVVAVADGAGVWGLLAGASTQLAVSSAIQFVAVRQVVPGVALRPIRMPRAELRSYVGLSGLLLLSQVSNVVDFEFDKVLLARYIGTAQGGRYDVGTAVTLQLRTLCVLPLAVLMPGVAELWQSRPQRAVLLYDGVSRLVLCASVILLGGAAVLGRPFARLWLGVGFGQAGTATAWLAVAMLLNAVAAPGAGWAIGRGWHRMSAIGAATNIAVNAVVSYTLVVTIGFHGALYGSVAGNAAATGVFLLLLRRRDPAIWRRGIVRPLLVGTPILGAALLLPAPRTWASFVLFGAVLTLVLVAAFAVTGCLPLRLLRGGGRREGGLDAPAVRLQELVAEESVGLKVGALGPLVPGVHEEQT